MRRRGGDDQEFLSSPLPFHRSASVNSNETCLGTLAPVTALPPVPPAVLRLYPRTDRVAAARSPARAPQFSPSIYSSDLQLAAVGEDILHLLQRVTFHQPPAAAQRME
eukprot:764998-Hanusia_phi.AAC.5